MPKVCSVLGCSREFSARGMCHTHYKKEWRKANPEKAKAETRSWMIKNPELAYARNQEWKKRNPEKVAKQKRDWKARKPWLAAASKAKRRAALLQATPAWADLEKIKEIYKNRPAGFHVDHYYPLQSDFVCGLHVPENLQYLSAFENCSKKNKVK